MTTTTTTTFPKSIEDYALTAVVCLRTVLQSYGNVSLHTSPFDRELKDAQQQKSRKAKWISLSNTFKLIIDIPVDMDDLRKVVTEQILQSPDFPKISSKRPLMWSVICTSTHAHTKQVYLQFEFGVLEEEEEVNNKKALTPTS
jgi:hypothetical protein